MLRTTTLSAAALLGLTLLVPTSAGAVGETCQGRPATLVGTEGQPLVGTEGADVIVTNGASRVDALGGDDLVCVNGPAPASADESSTLTLSAGPGNDVVEAVTAGWGTFGTLGLGADTYLGTSAAEHEIRAGEFLPLDSDTEADAIRVTAGTATIYSGADSRPNADVVEIGAGMVQWTGNMTPAGSLTGGPASTLRTTARSGDAMINAVRRTAVTETSSATYSGFDELEFATYAFKGTVRFRGTNEVERVRVEAPGTYDRVIDMRGGADFYASDGFGSKRSRYDGGAGRDQLLLSAPRTDVVADLDDGRFVAREGKRTVRRTFADFEDLVLASKKGRVDGTPRGEEIIVIACQTHVSADGGRDFVRLGARLTDWDNPGCASRRSFVDGGRGNDVLTGSNGRDRLIGGPGRDIAEGGQGRDTCRAEKTTSCEVRR